MTAKQSASQLPLSALTKLRQTVPLKTQLEGHLIAAQQPLTPLELAVATGYPVTQVSAALTALQQEYDGVAGQRQRGFELRHLAGGYRFYVRQTLDPLVAALVRQQHPARLSQAALETLAVIAYKQPLSRSAIAAIRAVNVDSVVRTLQAHGLITEADPDPETGATRYRTTTELLTQLGLNSISELPPIAPLLDDGAEGFENEKQ